MIIVKTPVQTGIDMQTLVVANAKTLSYKLTKYVATENRLKSLKCGKTQYS
ncbi:MAG: hypothetical protein WCJ45_09540 [bacterium]